MMMVKKSRWSGLKFWVDFHRCFSKSRTRQLMTFWQQEKQHCRRWDGLNGLMNCQLGCSWSDIWEPQRADPQKGCTSRLRRRSWLCNLRGKRFRIWRRCLSSRCRCSRRSHRRRRTWTGSFWSWCCSPRFLRCEAWWRLHRRRFVR